MEEYTKETWVYEANTFFLSYEEWNAYKDICKAYTFLKAVKFTSLTYDYNTLSLARQVLNRIETVKRNVRECNKTSITLIEDLNMIKLSCDVISTAINKK